MIAYCANTAAALALKLEGTSFAACAERDEAPPYRDTKHRVGCRVFVFRAARVSDS